MLHTFFLPISYCVKLFVPLDLPHIQFSLPSKEEIYHLQFLPTKIMSSASLRATPKSFCDETVLHFWPLPPCGESEVSVHTSQWCVLFFPPFFPPSLLPTPSLFFLSFILSFPTFLLSVVFLSLYQPTVHKKMWHRLLINQKTHILLSRTHI